VWALGLWSLATSPGCTDEERAVFSAEQRALIEELSPVPPLEPDSTNRYADEPDAAILGQKLFFDRRYSGPLVVGDDGSNGGLGATGETGRLACRDCHLGPWFIDTRSQPDQTSLGIDWFGRNSPTMINVATYEEWFGWVGFNDNLWGKNLIPAEFVMGTTRTGISRFVHAQYRDEYDAIFTEWPLGDALDPDSPDLDTRFPADATPLDPDSPWADMSPEDRDLVNRVFANFGKALAAYERRLVTGEAPFDRFVAGQDDAISASAKRGLALFIGKAACVECHAGPHLSDEQFHVTGVPQVGEHVFPLEVEDGRLGGIGVYLSWDFNTAGPYSDDPSIDRTEGITADESLRGAFRTKGLRNVEMTAPYMHTGHLATLEEVIEFYDEAGAEDGFQGTKDPLLVPLNLSSAEKADLVEFLRTLTSEPVDDSLLVDLTDQ
jgi:cytochrome c peroxidase